MRSDNTFAGAKDLGVYTGSKTQTFLLKGDLSRADRVDIFKFTFRAGASSNFGIFKGRVKGGGLTYTTFGQVPGVTNVFPSEDPPQRVPKSNAPFVERDNTPINNEVGLDIVIYLKLYKPTGKQVKYNARFTLRP